MSITITLPESFEIENYTGLQAFLTDHLELPQEVVDQLPNLIRLAEVRLDREIVSPRRETTATLTTVADTATLSLPTDFRQARSLSMGNYGPLVATAPSVLAEYPNAGRPSFYAIHGGQIVLAPPPNGTYTLTLRYQTKLTPLTQNSQVNWLLRDHADIYVYMASAVITQHMGDGQMSALYVSFANAAIEELRQQGVRYSHSGPMRPAVVSVP